MQTTDKKTANETKNATRYAVFAACFVFVCGMIAATVWDLPLAQKIADPTSAWAIVLEILGELPAMYFSVWNLGILVLCAWYTRTTRGRWLALLGVVLMYVLCHYAAGTTLDYLVQYYHLPLADGAPATIATVLTALATLSLFVYPLSRLSPATCERYRAIAHACVRAALTVLVVILAIKLLWGRVRYRQLLEMGSFEAFTPWWHPNGPGNTSHVSFPSGHTSNAAVFILLSAYFPRQRKWLLPTLLAWVVLCAASRLFIGAHFLSDVLCGGAISLTICYLFGARAKIAPDA